MAEPSLFARLFSQAFTGLYAQILRRKLMTLGLLDGLKTYIVAAAMVVTGLAQVLGVNLPAFDTHASGQLVLEGLAVLFLRHGLKTGA